MRLPSLIIVLYALSTAVAETSDPIALTHVIIVDVRDGSTHPDMTVVIEASRIAAVGSSKGTRLPKRARVIDAQGKFLIPGIWDMHVHSAGERRKLPMFLASGITGIRDMAGDAAELAESRRRIRSGELVGPRLLFSGPMLEGPPSEAGSDTWVIRSPEEGRHAVESLIKLHVDFIKVHDGLDRDTFLAIAAAAKAKGMRIVGHVPASMTPAEVSDLGQYSIEHLEFLPKPCLALFEPAHHRPPGCDAAAIQALLDRFARNGTWLDPTLQSFRYFAPKQWESILSGFREIAAQIRKSHVSILAGTDWSGFLAEKGDPPGGSLHDELAILVDAGFTPLEALRAATWNPALFLGLSESLGTIETGKTANLVLLEANPLVDIRNTRRVAGVVTEGRYFDRKALSGLMP